MHILEDLYVGDIHPNERTFKRDSQYAKALDGVVKAGDELTASLSENEKKLFEDFMDAQREVTVLTDCLLFCFLKRSYAYTLAEGARRMVDLTGANDLAVSAEELADARLKALALQRIANGALEHTSTQEEVMASFGITDEDLADMKEVEIE